MNFLVWCEEQDETVADARKIVASDAADAACQWGMVEDYESGDYSIVSGMAIQVKVQQEGTTLVETYELNGEPQPVYYANKVGGE